MSCLTTLFVLKAEVPSGNQSAGGVSGESSEVEAVITMENVSVKPGENVVARFAGMPPKSQLYVYKDLSSVPMDTVYVVSGEDEPLSGVFNIGSSLEPGEYTVSAIDSMGVGIAEAFFMVDEKPMELGNKNIFVMSDIHVMDESLLKNPGSAFDDYLNGDRKLLQESGDILEEMITIILRDRPELVLIPGDLTKDGERASHEHVVRQLNRLDAEGIKVLVIPGNHDVDNPHALLYDGDKTEYAGSVTMEEFAEIYAKYGYGDASARDENSLSYVSYPYDNLAVIGIDACMYEENKFIDRGDEADVCVTDGRLKPETLEWVCEQARKANAEGRQVIAIMHHNLAEHFNGQALIAAPYVVAEDSLVRAEFLKAGIRSVFTGHFHIQDIAMDYNEEKSDSIFDISTGSTVTYPCPYRYVTLNEDNTVMEIYSNILKDVDGYDEFDSYARSKLHDGLEPMVRGLVTDYWDVLNETLDTVIAGLGSSLSGMVKDNLLMPSTPDSLCDILLSGLKEPAIDMYMTFTESNEHLKRSEDVMAGLNAGVDSVLNDIIKPGVIGSLIKNVIGSKVSPLLDDYVGGIMDNVTYKGTEDESITNDMYLTIRLPKQKEPEGGDEPTGTVNVEDNSMSFAVYPTVTDGFVNISCVNIEEPTEIVVFDMGGRILHTERVDVCDEYETNYTFDMPGVYMIKLIGESKPVKVIVK